MLERRYQLTELRAEGDDKSLRISGHAAVFNQRSEQIFGFYEVILPGAFNSTIKKADVRALWNHDPNFVLGRNKAGTLHLKEDDVGLRSDIDLPDTQFARDLYTSIKRGDVNQMSFGFRTISDRWHTENKAAIRELVEVELFDVSPVTFPAYPQTDISARDQEIRSFYQQKMAEIAAETPADEEKAEEKDEKPVIQPVDLSYDAVLRRSRVYTDKADEHAAFLRQQEARRQFLDPRSPKPDPLSYSEVLKSAKKQFWFLEKE